VGGAAGGRGVCQCSPGVGANVSPSYGNTQLLDLISADTCLSIAAEPNCTLGTGEYVQV
jgi:hypothetical protein